MDAIREPARDTPVCCDVDLCVVGGSCTGVFAAVRAARLGLRVALVEHFGQLGGTATARMVCVWHSLSDTEGRSRIIAGLTAEVIDRLRRRGCVQMFDDADPDMGCTFVPAELACELDVLVGEQPRIRAFLHTRVCALDRDADGTIRAVIIEDVGGRRAIRCRAVVDASGDGGAARLAGLEVATPAGPLQPPTMAAIVSGVDGLRAQHPGFDVGRAVFDPAAPDRLDHGFLWNVPVPGIPSLELIYGTRVIDADCSDPDQLTRAEIEGRAQVRRIVGILDRRCAGQGRAALAALPAATGIRETRHARCLHRLSTAEVLDGTPFPDAIANGSYRVDIHHQRELGITFRYLDGREELVLPGQPRRTGRWRPPRAQDPTFYQIPYRSLVPRGSRNLWVAGRCVDAEAGAFGGIRVMVTCNQMGEAAGVAAAVMLGSGAADPAAVDAQAVRRALAAGGSIVR